MDPVYCEDAVMLFNQLIMDARSLKDDKLVANHCVPIHGILPDPFDPQLTFMIMPYLRPCQNPEFGTIGDIIDFVNQTLEGLVFMHKHHVAHRDKAVENIMVDAASLYPEGRHPVRYDYTPDGLYEVAPLSRAGRSMTYHDTAFGLSLRFPPGATPSVHVFAHGNLFHQEFEQWEEIRADHGESLYRWHLGPKSEPAIEWMFNDTFAAAREGIYLLKMFAI
ncbi:hypothetical protein BD413DRAFT_611939 [Trametes elegans]|nr:hypothetical protein BD413DRAFT_611939 [Trametes elegans]